MMIGLMGIVSAILLLSGSGPPMVQFGVVILGVITLLLFLWLWSTRLKILVHKLATVLRTREEGLHAEQNLTKWIIHDMPGLFYVAEGGSGRFVQRNANWGKVTGYSDDDLDSMTVLDFVEDKGLGAHFMQEVNKWGTASWMENLVLTKAGQKIPYIFTGERLIIEGKTFLVGLGLDISDRIQKEAALSESEAHFRTLVENAPEAIAILDSDLGAFVDVNANAEQLWGLSKEELLRRSLIDVSPPTQPDGRPSREAAMSFIKKTMEGNLQTFEWTHLNKKTGNEIFCLVCFIKLPSSEQNILRASIIDITERERAQRKIAQRETELRLILDNLPGLVASVDKECRYRTANRMYLDMFNMTEKEIRGKHAPDVLAKVSRDNRVQDHISQVLSGKQVTYEVDLPFKIDVRPVQITYVPDIDEANEVQGFYMLGVDIHDRKLAEEKLRTSEERLRLMLETFRGGGWDWNIATGEVFFSDCWLESLGYQREEVEPDINFWKSIVHPKDMPRVMESLQAHFEGWNFDYKCEKRMRIKSGEYRWSLDVGKVVARDAQDKPLRMVSIEMDITERKRAEEKLRHNEENLRTTLNSIGDAVIATDIDGRIMRMNPVAGKLTGWTVEHTLGKPLNEIFHIVHATTRDVAENPVAEVLSTGKTVGLSNHTVLIARDGTEYQIASSGAPIRSDNGETLGVVLVFRDVTAEFALQEKLRHSEKMRAIGQLSGGIAHDFNNMLGGIMGAAELLMLEESSLGEKNIELIDVIMNASTQAADLTAKLLAFGRKGTMTSIPIDFHRIIDDAVNILQRTIDKKIRISVKKDAQNETLTGDCSQLQNALMNIVINASHAMPGGGKIQITTKNIYLDETYCAASTFEIEPGEFIGIEIRDTGCGIPLENLPKIFEPFYTTKESGKGTGLGLAAVYGIVQEHHGAINVYSEVGEGTSFHIFLPCSKTRAKPEQFNSNVVTGAGQTLLLVDDEKLIRFTGQRILEKMGYKVLLAENGQEAVEVFQEQHTGVSLVIMDMIMPKMNGHEAFIKMKKIDKNCKVVISSGFTKDESLDELKQLGLAGFIHKPFRLLELSQLLANILGS